jgi:hypothetical protein
MPAILDTWEAEIREIAIPGQLGQNVHETPISTNSYAWWHTLVILSYIGG